MPAFSCSDESVMRWLAIIFGLLTAISFVLVGIWPAALDLADMPIFVRTALVLFGSVMLLSSTFAIRHAMGVREALKRTNPEIVSATVEVREDSESTTYLIVTFVGDQTWAVPAYYGKGVDRLESGQATEILAWRDPNTGAPVAFSVDGHSIETYPHTERR